MEDYGHVGLTLRAHPVSLFEAILRNAVSSAVLRRCRHATARGSRQPGLVLVRQRPGSANGIMFITIEDETGIANLVIWPQVFEKNRRTILGFSLLAVRGRIQREGDVVHLVARHLKDLSGELASVGERDARLRLPHGRGDEFHHGSPTPDPRGLPPRGTKPRDIYVPDLHIDTIRVKPRDFR